MTVTAVWAAAAATVATAAAAIRSGGVRKSRRRRRAKTATTRKRRRTRRRRRKRRRRKRRRRKRRRRSAGKRKRNCARARASRRPSIRHRRTRRRTTTRSSGSRSRCCPSSTRCEPAFRASRPAATRAAAVPSKRTKWWARSLAVSSSCRTAKWARRCCPVRAPPWPPTSSKENASRDVVKSASPVTRSPSTRTSATSWAAPGRLLTLPLLHGFILAAAFPLSQPLSYEQGLKLGLFEQQKCTSPGSFNIGLEPIRDVTETVSVHNGSQVP